MKNTKLKEGGLVKYTYTKKGERNKRKIGEQRTDKLFPQILSVFPKDQEI